MLTKQPRMQTKQLKGEQLKFQPQTETWQPQVQSNQSAYQTATGKTKQLKQKLEEEEKCRCKSNNQDKNQIAADANQATMVQPKHRHKLHNPRQSNIQTQTVTLDKSGNRRHKPN